MSYFEPQQNKPSLLTFRADDLEYLLLYDKIVVGSNYKPCNTFQKNYKQRFNCLHFCFIN